MLNRYLSSKSPSIQVFRVQIKWGWGGALVPVDNADSNAGGRTFRAKSRQCDTRLDSIADVIVFQM